MSRPKKVPETLAHLITEERYKGYHHALLFTKDFKHGTSVYVRYVKSAKPRQTVERKVDDVTPAGIIAALDWAEAQGMSAKPNTRDTDSRTMFQHVGLRWVDESLLTNAYAPATQDNYLSHFRAHVLPMLINKSIGSIHKPYLLGELTKLNDAGASADVFDKTLQVMRHIFRWAVAEGYIASDPTEGIKGKNAGKERRPTTAQEDDFLYPEEVMEMLWVLEHDWKPLRNNLRPPLDEDGVPAAKVVMVPATYYRAHFMFLAFLGLRIGELAAVRDSHIRRFRDGTGEIAIRESRREGTVGDPKTKNSFRTLPLDKGLLRELDALLELQRTSHAPNDEGLIFTTHCGYPLSSKRFGRRVMTPLVAYCEANGLIENKTRKNGSPTGSSRDKNITPNTLRHTAFTSLAHEQTPLVFVKGMAGHAKTKTTERYIGSGDIGKQEAVKRQRRAFSAASKSVEKKRTPAPKTSAKRSRKPTNEAE